MADRIKLLPEVVANQIAAGEVVNRPSSVVKEMMENAIDAGAKTVTVNCCEGGRDLIQIVDDGCGMSPTDARMAFDRHATSKIASVDDIYKLHTFGFRGEALASIAAVAQVELKTRQEGEELGSQTFINGGEFDKQKPCGCPVGSQFFVRNLFYNVPARRRFLEKSTTSSRQIRDEFERVALCNPQIAFKLYSNNAPIYDLERNSLRGRIVDVVGKSIKNNLLEVSAETSLVKIEGFVGRPAAAKKSSYKQFLFVNGRYFKSPYFYKAVMKAYEKLIPAQTQPDIFLYLTIDPERIDVNVHPQKTEVKFSDGEAIWQIINAAVRETLAKTGAVPLMDFDDEGAIDIPVASGSGRVYGEPKAASVEGYNPFREGYTSGATAGRRSQADLSDFAGEYRATPRRERFDMWPSDSLAGAENEEFAIVDSGESFHDFLSSEQPQTSGEEFEFVESADAVQQRFEGADEAQFEDVIVLPEMMAAARYRGRLVVVDLRRARERVSFEEYEAMLGGGSSVSQQLLFPERLVLTNDEVGLLKGCLADLSAIGFDLRVVDDCTVELSGTPADMEGVEIDRLLYDVIHSIAEGDEPTAVRRQQLAAMVAQRRAAAMRGAIGVEQTEVLLSRLAMCENMSFSPSGKAIMVEISTGEIRSRLG
ncbi:MAG: DNA mismatch repair endonuclease MutL [Rikenellaceae bacterium]|nr:DNA mismatch repair endonuclease MutL [Rikenellaceae bacterium]MBR2932135.1 DNA mismatch repair endonuclease MutL [Rikenellaceae bacterium]